MPQALPYPTRISQSYNQTRKFRTVRSQFGGGYSQSRPDGTNSSFDELSLAWEGMDTTELGVIVVFFEAIGGWDYFTYQPPGVAVVRKYEVVGQYSMTVGSGSLYNISFNALQVFKS